jgi:transcriptional regulator with XRE-family HTH domain
VPPKRRAERTGATRHNLAYQLREVIESRGLSAYAAARLAGVDPGVVSRFMTGERDIRLETDGRLAAALGLRLVEVGRRGRPARLARATSPGPDTHHEHPHKGAETIRQRQEHPLLEESWSETTRHDSLS